MDSVVLINEVEVIVDGKPADTEQKIELFDKVYGPHAVSIPSSARKIRHFSFDYAKQRATDLGHV